MNRTSSHHDRLELTFDEMGSRASDRNGADESDDPTEGSIRVVHTADDAPGPDSIMAVGRSATYIIQGRSDTPDGVRDVVKDWGALDGIGGKTPVYVFVVNRRTGDAAVLKRRTHKGGTSFSIPVGRRRELNLEPDDQIDFWVAPESAFDPSGTHGRDDGDDGPLDVGFDRDRDIYHRLTADGIPKCKVYDTERSDQPLIPTKKSAVESMGTPCPDCEAMGDPAPHLVGAPIRDDDDPTYAANVLRAEFGLPRGSDDRLRPEEIRAMIDRLRASQEQEGEE